MCLLLPPPSSHCTELERAEVRKFAVRNAVAQLMLLGETDKVWLKAAAAPVTLAGVLQVPAEPQHCHSARHQASGLIDTARADHVPGT